jgi:hypothetical protein
MGITHLIRAEEHLPTTRSTCCCGRPSAGGAAGVRPRAR